MGDPFLRRCCQRLGDLTPDAQHLGHLEGPSGDELFERLAVEQFHDEIQRVAFAPDIEESTHMRMRESRD